MVVVGCVVEGSVGTVEVVTGLVVEGVTGVVGMFVVDDDVVVGITAVVVVVVMVVDGSILLVVVVVVGVFVVEVGRAVEGGPVSPGGVIVVLSEGIVVVLGMVVGTDDVLLEKTEVVVVSDGASVVDDARVLVGQC